MNLHRAYCALSYLRLSKFCPNSICWIRYGCCRGEFPGILICCTSTRTKEWIVWVSKPRRGPLYRVHLVVRLRRNGSSSSVVWIQVWIEFGRLKLPQGYHPNDVEEEWGKLIIEMLEREKLLRPAVERWPPCWAVWGWGSFFSVLWSLLKLNSININILYFT